MRELNKVTRKDAHGLPGCDMFLRQVPAKATHFTKMDLCKGFYQILLDPESRPYTAFWTPFGLYEFVRMPMGIRNAPGTLHRVMHTVLAGLEDR